jgi:hypothetical protein
MIVFLRFSHLYRNMLKKILKSAGIILLDVFVLAIIVISPVAKYVIEKNDIDWLGREVIVNNCFVNPLTGTIWLSGLKVFEQNSTSVFFDANYVSANLELGKLVSGTYEFSSMTIYTPTARIIRYRDSVNFTDIIEKFTPDPLDKTPRENIRFNLLDFTIKNGKFHYEEDLMPVSFFAKDINISSPGLRWDNDTVALNYSFTSENDSGTVIGKTDINRKNLNYLFELKIDNYSLEIVNQYLHDLTNEGVFKAQLNADIKTSGNFQNVDSVKASGVLAMHEIHFGKKNEEDFAFIKELKFSAQLLNPFEQIFNFDSITIQKPYLKYELYDELDNIQVLFGKGGANVAAATANPKKVNLVIEIVRLVEKLARNVLRSDYKLDCLAMTDGNLEFVDYSIDGIFKAAAIPFNLRADSIYNQRKLVKLEINSGIMPNGRMNINVSLDPKDSSYFDMNYHFQNIPITMFNPYVVNYTSFRFDSGKIKADGNWKVRNGNIDSENHLVIVNPGLTKRAKEKQSSWIPMPFLVALAKEKGNKIDYQIPISGSLNDPDFNIMSILSDILKNVLLKPVRVIPIKKGKKG